ncbi:MAG: hypothetical protein AAGB31_07785 [Bdellovibrio sp.]
MKTLLAGILTVASLTATTQAHALIKSATCGNKKGLFAYEIQAGARGEASQVDAWALGQLEVSVKALYIAEDVEKKEHTFVTIEPDSDGKYHTYEVTETQSGSGSLKVYDADTKEQIDLPALDCAISK